MPKGYGKKFYSGLVDWLKTTVMDEGNIEQEDLTLFTVVDTADQAVRHINQFYSKYLLRPNF